MKSPLLEDAERELAAAQADYRKQVHQLNIIKRRLDAAIKRHRHLLFLQIEVDIETKAAGPFQRIRR